MVGSASAEDHAYPNPLDAPTRASQVTTPVLPGLLDVPVAPALDPVSRHCSSMGALDASERVGRQCLALLTIYRQRGPLTDAEAADAMRVDRTTVNARRNELVSRGLVARVGTKKNALTHISNTTWGLA